MKNQSVLAIAFRKAKAKRRAIKKFGITPDWTEEQIESLTKDLAEAKAIEANKPMSDFLDGQQWYVESLVEFSGMTAKQQLDAEYDLEFPNSATEDELVAALDAA